MHHTISDSSIQTNTKYFKECPIVSTGESRRKRVPTPMHKFTRSLNPQVDHQNKHQVDHVNIPLSPQISTCKTYIKCSQILKDSIDKKTSKGKFNSSQEDREGKTPYDSSISTKLAIHQDRTTSRTRERERDQTHSY